MNFEEKRRHTRHPFIAEIKFSSDSPPVMARIADISKGGIFVDIVVPLREETKVSVSFHLPDEQPDVPVTGGGKVAWTEPTVGMGIEFETLGEGCEERLAKFLSAV